MSHHALFDEIDGYIAADHMLHGVTPNHRAAVAAAILTRLPRFTYNPASGRDRGYRLRLRDAAGHSSEPR